MTEHLQPSWLIFREVRNYMIHSEAEMNTERKICLLRIQAVRDPYGLLGYIWAKPVERIQPPYILGFIVAN
uniref:Uncharacterized protein n=1 Tax=Cucumis sativus TaxID=3659 RepID=A0A0A0L206_CUCSA